MNSLTNYKTQIQSISEKGPSENDYAFLIEFFNQVSQMRSMLNQDDIKELRTWFLGAMDDERTLQGHVCKKPRGYDGDYTIIDKIYQHHIASDDVLAKWDSFFHLGDAPKAVRNRKTFFKNILKSLPNGSTVLNLASGSCRDIFEFSIENETNLSIDCVDFDEGAIEFGKDLLSNSKYLSVNFIKSNIFKFIPSKKYDLIWSAGLFDYLEDKHFKSLVERFSEYINLNGEFIVGNFNTINNSKSYMEFGNWFLHHRDKQSLLDLSSSIEAKNIWVDSEPLNVNLFLRAKF